MMLGELLSAGFGPPGRFTYWYIPPNLHDTIGLKDGDVARVIDMSRPHNLPTFARALAKIAYCNAVMRYGLAGFRPLVLPDIILGRYPNIAYFVGSDPTLPRPPYPRGQQHSVTLGDLTYKNMKLLTAAIRLFGDSGSGDKGMPFYTVIVGSEGRRKVLAKPRLPRLPKITLFPAFDGGDDGASGCDHRHIKHQRISEPVPEDAPSDLRDDLGSAHDAVAEADEVFIRRLIKPSQVVGRVEFQLASVPPLSPAHLPAHAQHVPPTHQVNGLAGHGDSHSSCRLLCDRSPINRIAPGWN
jgi:hypothetical protein